MKMRLQALGLRPLWAFLGRVFFSQLSPIVALGRRKILVEADMPVLPRRLEPHTVENDLKDATTKSARAFMLAYVRSQVGIARYILAFALGMLFFQLCSPYLLHRLIAAIESPGSVSFSGQIVLAFGLVACSLLNAVCIQHYFHNTILSVQTGINKINARIYHKAMSLSRAGLLRRPMGDVVNHIGTDTESVAQLLWTIFELFNSSMLLLLSGIMLFKFLGIAALAAYAVLLVLSPMTKMFAKRFVVMDEALMKFRDQRVSLISQIVHSIRVIKYFTWEHLVSREVDTIREQEVGARRKLIIAECVSLLLYVSITTLLSVVSFTVYKALGHELTAAVGFACIALFAAMEHPFGNLSELISQIASAYVGAYRIVSFLNEEERQTPRGATTLTGQAVGIVANRLTLEYSDGSWPVLHDVSFTIAPGEAVAIVGPVGSGKSSLLLALLGELVPVMGEVTFTGLAPEERPRISYCAQRPFIFNASLRENILLGEPDTNVETALSIAELEQDFSTYDFTLDSEIGEHGINLSGGQKQRVSLARAIVYRPGLALLDDSLSAVDEKTEQLIASNLIFGAWNNITRVVVTHRLAMLNQFHKIIFFDKGKIEAMGTLEQLLLNPRFASFYFQKLPTLVKSQVAAAPTPISAFSMTATEQSITVKEDRETGKVKRHVYVAYLQGLGGKTKARPWIIAALFGSTLGVTLLPVLQNLWLASWTSKDGSSLPFSISTIFPWLYPSANTLVNIGVYGLFGVMLIFAFFGQHLLWALRSLKAAKDLHARAFFAMLHTRVRFFDSNPTGRILNRFSQDVDAVERNLPASFEQMVRSGTTVIVSMSLLTCIFPKIVLALIPVIILYYRLQGDFRASGREAKRLASISKSPRFAQFKQSVEGMVTIRSYNKERFFSQQFFKALGAWQRNYYAMIMLNRWFSIRIPLLSGLISFATVSFLLFATRDGMLASGTAGLVLIYSLQLWGNMNWVIRSFSECEAKLVSVERLLNFSNLEREEDVVALPSLEQKSPWPTQGVIEFDGVYARYDTNLPHILRGLNMRVHGDQITGIVGRTGAGKSTLFHVLYRFVEVSSGEVRIDGQNIASIPLSRLRRAISIIPQDPVLFAGTLRENLDRFNLHSDEGIWSVLEKVYLREFVQSLGSLQIDVRENGDNFSQGQRQLVCLARALLADAKIIVMDEATANVDVETDLNIHHVIKNHCRGRTVVIVAHRERTISNCDVIFEIDHGTVRSQFRPGREQTPSRIIENLSV